MSCWQHNKVTHFERKIAVYFKKLNTFSHRIQQFHFLLITQEKKKKKHMKVLVQYLNKIVHISLTFNRQNTRSDSKFPQQVNG